MNLVLRNNGFLFQWNVSLINLLVHQQCYSITLNFAADVNFRHLYFFPPLFVELTQRLGERRLESGGYQLFKDLFIWRRVTRLTELLALSGNSPSIENYRSPGEMFTWRKRVTRLGEFPVERGGISPRRDEYFTM